ncbi:DNA gyrase/topoisomerase IV, subunit A family protein, partial [Chlamydia psittaci 06-1683]
LERNFKSFKSFIKLLVELR